MKKFLWLRYFLPLLLLPLVIKGVTSEIGAVDTDWFCTSCHSMRPFTDDYWSSTHYSGRTGYGGMCVNCHVQGGLISIGGVSLLAKGVAAELTRPIRGKKEAEMRRVLLAMSVREGYIKTESAECSGCHDEKLMVPRRDRGKKAHQDIERTKWCIDCHYNLVHAKVPWERKEKETIDDLLIE